MKNKPLIVQENVKHFASLPHEVIQACMRYQRQHRHNNAFIYEFVNESPPQIAYAFQSDIQKW